MNTPQRKFFLCIWHWQCPKIFPGNLNSIKKSKGCMNGATLRVGKRWQNVYKLIMKSTRTFQEFWSYPLRFCSPPRWRDVYSPPYGRQGIDIVKITDLVVSCKTSPTYQCSWLCWLSCRELTWSSSVGLQSPHCIWCWSSSTSRSTRARAATSKDGVTFSSNNKL